MNFRAIAIVVVMKPRIALELVPTFRLRLFILDTGIYSMDVLGERVLTTSKDSSIGLHVLDSSCMRNERVIDGFHNGVVKSGSWRDECVFATSGNDRTLSVFDRRAGVLAFESC